MSLPDLSPKKMPFLQPFSATSAVSTLITQYPWDTTTLGCASTWHPSIKTVVALILAQPTPIVTLWGPEGYMIYNDAYAVFAGGRHPQLLGSKVREGWPEVAAFNDNVMKTGLAGGKLSYSDQELTLYRNGQAEQVWMNLDYSPIYFDDGTVGGVMALVVETSAKVKAERRIAVERERLQSMFEQAPGFMAMVSGPEHKFELVNPSYSQLVGYRDVLGRTAKDIFPDLAGQGYFERLDEAFKTGRAVSGLAMPFNLAATALSPQRARYLDFVYQPLKDSSGEVFGIFVQGYDVTERIAAETALRASEEQFRMFAQAMPHHVWTGPADGKLDWFNDRVYEYTGLTSGELDGDGWGRVIDPADVALASARWTHALKTGEPYETEFRIRRADGSYRWHLARAVPIRDDNGIVQRWIGSSTDIDDQKGAAAQLAQINATLEEEVAFRTAERDRMWRLSKDILLVADFDACITAVSPAFTTILGWKVSEVIGTSFMSLVHPDDRANTISQVTALSEGAHVFRFENRYQRKDGTYCTLSWTASPDAQFIHAIGRDITADLARADAMRRTEVALQQAQKMETIGKLTGGVAHDFNNLLQVISGNLQLVMPLMTDNPKAHTRLANALAGVERGAKLANYLLAFARRQPLEPKVVKLSRLITGMEDMLRRTLGEEIETETVMSGGLWSTAIDIVQVENAILNLAINARDAMQGRGKLTIEVNNALLDSAYCESHTDVTPGQYVMIAVSDTGTGMTPEVLAQAFEPFFSTKPEGKGTGLGLSMVYGLVKQSGGHIKIYSEVGEGTTVKLYLLRSYQAEEAYVALDSQPVVGGAETILVAEDDDAVRSTVVDMLTELGYRVLKAHDAAAALAVIDSGIHVDLLFTDVVMPGALRSPELARLAKERLPHLAVLFTSGYTENAIVHGGRLDPGVELIGKPYTKETLARKIRHVLNLEPAGMDRESAAACKKTPQAMPSDGYKILVVEDEEDIRANTRDLLQYLGHHVVAVATAEEALEMLDTSFDLLLTDLQLPGIHGDALIASTRQLFPTLHSVIASGGGAQVEGAASLRKPYGVAELREVMSSLRNSS